ncbi:MAG: GNAT family N-acetyltransferase [bacterium]|nr:GNAT family N-acetyltransferase [bacterium]
MDTRTCTPDDLHRLAALCAEQLDLQRSLDAERPVAPGLDMLEYLSGRCARPHGAILVASEANELLGYVDIGIVGTPPRSLRSRTRAAISRMLGRPRGSSSLFADVPKGFIYDLFIAEPFRHSELRVGAALVRASFQWFESRGVDSVEATVAVENDSARRFFEKLGFVATRILLRSSLT